MVRTAFTAERPGSIPNLCRTAKKKKEKEKPAAGVPGHSALALLCGTVPALEEASRPHATKVWDQGKWNSQQPGGL